MDTHIIHLQAPEHTQHKYFYLTKETQHGKHKLYSNTYSSRKESVMKEFVGYNAKQFKVPGVYLISAGPYSYVGSATIVSRRLHNHASKLRHNKHYCQNIQGCFNNGDEVQVSLLEDMVGATDGRNIR